MHPVYCIQSTVTCFYSGLYTFVVPEFGTLHLGSPTCYITKFYTQLVGRNTYIPKMNQFGSGDGHEERGVSRGPSTLTVPTTCLSATSLEPPTDTSTAIPGRRDHSDKGSPETAPTELEFVNPQWVKSSQLPPPPAAAGTNVKASHCSSLLQRVQHSVAPSVVTSSLIVSVTVAKGVPSSCVPSD